jgi:hypothetical protein
VYVLFICFHFKAHISNKAEYSLAKWSRRENNVIQIIDMHNVYGMSSYFTQCLQKSR